MTVEDLVAEVYLKSAGKLPTFLEGSTKWNKILAIANFYNRKWQRERGVDWYSLYNPAYLVGTVSNTDSYELDTDDVLRVSQAEQDYVRIFMSSGQTTYYPTINADKQQGTFEGQNKNNYFGKFVSVNGPNLVFNHIFTSSDPEFGGEIYAPIYQKLEDLTSASDDILVDDPNWLVLMTAAEYVRNDITKQGQYPNLIAEANDLMEGMKEANEAQVETVIRPWSAPGGFGGHGFSNSIGQPLEG